MKRRIAVVGVCFVSVLLLGAVTVETVNRLAIDPKVISSWGELAEVYYAGRDDAPPLPSPVPYEDVCRMMEKGDWSFLSEPLWSYKLSGGTCYVAEDSRLARLKLPMELLIYEDLQRNETVILGSKDGEKYQGLALFDAPEFISLSTDAASILTDNEKQQLFFQDLSMRRVVWEVTLKPEEDAWMDLVRKEEAASASPALLDGGEMMAMSLPDPITDFRMIQDGTNLSVNLPDEFEGAEIVLLSCTNLVEGSWNAVSTNIAASSGEMVLADADIPNIIYETSVSTNWVNCPNHTDPGETCTNQTLVVITNSTPIGGGVIFYRTSASSDLDADSDGLDNVSEYAAGTDYLNRDSDGDLMLDGYEIDSGLNPLGTTGVDGALGDVDQDGYLNLEEMNHECAPQLPSNAVLSVRYYYDEENRLREVYQHVL